MILHFDFVIFIFFKQEFHHIAIKLIKRNTLKMNKIRYSFCRIIGKDGVFCMSISVSDELQLFAQEIQSLLSPNTLFPT
ncbi:hypothetical protein BW892_14130 [Bacillus cereus]|uniref:Uncharacterized protein n=1 Tax=Bacillus cereus TaxID=1396 RepID=A0A1S9UST0_BACCE|nr:hypothetical protein BW892_14130 [Bacillus cereus]